MQTTEIHEHWSSRIAFILAAVGSAVGLGNFWRFPYTAGENGGGAFVLIYIFCVAAIALPILIAELMIGRRGKLSAVASSKALARAEGRSSAWQAVGWVGMIASFLILTFYSVIGGWIVAYIPSAASGALAGISAEESGVLFGDLLADPAATTFYHTVFMAITVFIVSRGLTKGIEAAVKILMPLFFVMLLGVLAFSVSIGDTHTALRFLFSPDFSQITMEVVLQAIGQAFFSIGVGSAIMITYGAYLTQATRIPFASTVICGADTAVALLAGIAIFPIVFAVGLDPAAGPGLIFVTLPVAFGQMPFGSFYGTGFFVLALFAAITSSIALLEITVSWAEEKSFLNRRQSAYLAGFAVWVIGIGSALSTNAWSEFYPLGMFETFKETGILDLFDYLTANILMPLGGVLVALFVGWRVSEETIVEELGMSRGPAYRIWRFCLRWLAPVAVGAVMYSLTIGA